MATTVKTHHCAHASTAPAVRAPAARNVAMASASVAPVVSTSSTTSTRRPETQPG